MNERTIVGALDSATEFSSPIQTFRSAASLANDVTVPGDMVLKHFPSTLPKPKPEDFSGWHPPMISNLQEVRRHYWEHGGIRRGRIEVR